MKNTQTQTREEILTQYIERERQRIDQLIDSYIVIRRLRPAYAREWLDDIRMSLDMIKRDEEEIAYIRANPDMPF